ncbi:hypothetical protein CPC08DRAFT_101843 [Agrocybe pediades]|nr:hypothetical protein CPC08DRAFT_101843 [Agrocybe pediades]
MSQTQPNDPETLEKLRSRFVRHESHYDVSRWHLVLHPSVVKECARNALPGPLGRVMHPTNATLAADDGRRHNWKSRSHRKGRYRNTSSPDHPSIRRKVGNMITHIEYWNVSWWVSVGFTLGSIVWVVNGFAAFLPFCNSHFTKADHSTGWTAFLGATIFEIASIFGIWEAWNRNDAATFGSNVKQALSPSKSGGSEKRPITNNNNNNSESQPHFSEENGQRWIWFSADPKFFYEVGFLAGFFQLLAASIFWISGFTAIPTIQSAIEENQGLTDGIFWTPQVIGGSGFAISAIFIMLEAQDVWWKPKPTSLGWHVGFWNGVGAVGFTLCGAFGYASTVNTGMAYQSSLSTFWGGWAFLIASVIQWYECVNPKEE